MAGARFVQMELWRSQWITAAVAKDIVKATSLMDGFRLPLVLLGQRSHAGAGGHFVSSVMLDPFGWNTEFRM